MKNPKKVHPNGLRNLSDAINTEDALAGAVAWTQAIQNGEYTFVVLDEHAIDETTDLLIVVRRKV